jgi:hypothetical protein
LRRDTIVIVPVSRARLAAMESSSVPSPSSEAATARAVAGAVTYETNFGPRTRTTSLSPPALALGEIATIALLSYWSGSE